MSSDVALRGSAAPMVRASDAERERVAGILRAAAAAGLLTLEEADERLAGAYAARYRSELAQFTADLPDGGRRLLADTPAARTAARNGMLRHIVAVAVLAALLVTAWFFSDVDFFWPIWPIGFLVFSVFAHGRRIGRWGNVYSRQ